MRETRCAARDPHDRVGQEARDRDPGAGASSPLQGADTMGQRSEDQARRDRASCRGPG